MVVALLTVLKVPSSWALSIVFLYSFTGDLLGILYVSHGELEAGKTRMTKT